MNKLGTVKNVTERKIFSQLPRPNQTSALNGGDPVFQATKTGLSRSACLPRTPKPVNQGDLSISNSRGNSARGSQHT